MSPFMRVSALSAGCFIVLLGVTLVIASPISGSNNGANEGADVPRSNPLLEKALQRANYRLSQLPSDDYLSSLRDRIFFVRAPAFQRTSPFTRKRSCFINAGMGNNCDFKDLLSAASSRRLWQSGNSPGKRSGSLPTALSTAEYPYVPVAILPLEARTNADAVEPINAAFE